MEHNLNWLAILLIIVTVSVLIIVLLSFFGPTEPKHPFWKKVYRIRSHIDFVSYWLINAMAIATILLMLGAIIYALFFR